MSTKLEPKSHKCTFVGYPKETKGYYFYNHKENKVFVARTGVFLEKDFLSHKEDRRNIELEEVQQQQDTEPEVERFSQTVEENSTDLETRPLRISTRERHEPERYGFLVTTHGDVILVDYDEPKTYQEAVSSPDSEKWLEAMRSEMDSMSDNQIHGIDYDETFSPVALFKSIRILLAIAAFHDYEIWQMDVKTAFLNGKLEEDVYMTQPEGFVTPENAGKVCKLQRNEDEPCVYKKFSESIVSFLILYVDDILIIGNDIPTLQSVKNTYIDKVLKRFNMEASKKGFLPMTHGISLSKEMCPSTSQERERMSQIPYASTIESIMYAMICTRPDLSYALSMTSRYQANPGEGHWVAKLNTLQLAKRQKKSFGSKKFVTELGVVPSISDALELYFDNNGTIAQAKEPRSHKRSKHILRRFHLLREIVDRGDVEICKVHTDDNIADPLTKHLPQQKHDRHTESLGIRYVSDWS
ncbi:hypothetical protein V6N12_031610 [Hibiscus sabdariffa]|uniref:Reverse transcriptase Ty1/copia-type domain-containing protein n=1 Tax=Hibiscus sabdariffa TaxID=183260 RepID=A0ABR2DUZ3_9ROSI